MSYCTNCGNTLGTQDRFCSRCGRPVQPQPYEQNPTRSLYDPRKERQEAIDAGEYALDCLQQAEELLEKAKSWGVLDILGGGFVTSMIKRSRMSDAQSCIREAKAALDRFAAELRDVPELGSADLEMDSFLSFADWFFDGFLVDVMAQKQINDSLRQVQQAIDRVEQILDRL